MQTVKKFRLQQLNGLQSHVARYGPLKQSESSRPSLPNPFLPLLNPHTAKWRPPKYSLRRQAELVKMAKISNTLHLLPPGPKFAALDHAVPPIADELASTSEAPSKAAEDGAWSTPVEWQGEFKSKAVSGAEIGSRLYSGKKRMFKGHRWERVLEKRKKKRVILMRDMAKRVASYKAYYHRRKPNPLKPARSAKAPKLPF
ncbi:54S ribosomal protein L25, mitochondrial [Pleurotus pulmonarius]|nr:54S ribosomal protein L25, mitochondrial [Pleurotus pulmonarius]KAF4586728.1 54S ribosomal protein L25, mitochondrial [Pleurotus pulmonarius]